MFNRNFLGREFQLNNPNLQRSVTLAPIHGRLIAAMTSLTLSLAPPALIRLHDVLICLSKFSDTVAIEAEHDLVRLQFQ